MNTSEMQSLAKMAAKEAVSETFLMFGLDTKDPISVQNQFATLRNIHYGMRQVRNVIIAGVLGAMVSGGVYAFWAGFKASAAVPPAIVGK
jgi:hypothetical protein